jgi:hypothetical protein
MRPRFLFNYLFDYTICIVHIFGYPQNISDIDADGSTVGIVLGIVVNSCFETTVEIQTY